MAMLLTCLLTLVRKLILVFLTFADWYPVAASSFGDLGLQVVKGVPTESGWKVLIVDDEALRMISACCRM